MSFSSYRIFYSYYKISLPSLIAGEASFAEVAIVNGFLRLFVTVVAFVVIDIETFEECEKKSGSISVPAARPEFNFVAEIADSTVTVAAASLPSFVIYNPLTKSLF